MMVGRLITALLGAMAVLFGFFLLLMSSGSAMAIPVVLILAGGLCDLRSDAAPGDFRVGLPPSP